LEKTFPSATLSTINPIWPLLGSNTGGRNGKQETNRLSYGTTGIIDLERLEHLCLLLSNGGERSNQTPDAEERTLNQIEENQVSA
jgi:hypothetical protein